MIKKIKRVATANLGNNNTYTCMYVDRNIYYKKQLVNLYRILSYERDKNNLSNSAIKLSRYMLGMVWIVGWVLVNDEVCLIRK